MKRLFISLLLCSTLLIALFGSAIAIAESRAQPGSDLIPQLGLCNDTPCYLGIAPDKTLFHDVPAKIANTQADAVELALDVFELPTLQTHLHIIRTGDSIDELDISLKKGINLSAGEVIRRYGIPCLTASLGSTLAVKYPHMAFFFAMKQNGNLSILAPNSRVVEIRLLGGTANDCTPVDNEALFRWRGFTIYW